jgi:hypothetical protein
MGRKSITIGINSVIQIIDPKLLLCCVNNARTHFTSFDYKPVFFDHMHFYSCKIFSHY